MGPVNDKVMGCFGGLEMDFFPPVNKNGQKWGCVIIMLLFIFSLLFSDQRGTRR